LRRAAIRLLIESRGMMSEREFATALLAQGIEASSATVHRDLAALGYKAHPARKTAGRPSEQLELPQGD
jgi:arginine repressor